MSTHTVHFYVNARGEHMAVPYPTAAIANAAARAWSERDPNRYQAIVNEHTDTTVRAVAWYGED
jgi:hypothetical protein